MDMNRLSDEETQGLRDLGTESQVCRRRLLFRSGAGAEG